jgi:hypothetical protein
LFNKGCICNYIANISGFADDDIVVGSNSDDIYEDIYNELGDDFNLYETNKDLERSLSEVVFTTDAAIMKIDNLETEKCSEVCELYYTYFAKGEYLDDHDVFDLLTSDTNPEKRIKSSAISNQAILHSYISGLKNQAFQDGIKLSIYPNYIMPFGMCYAKVNLTSRARFDLNVTRNAIDESESKLTNWSDNIGYLIQSYVLTNILKKFEKYKLNYDIKGLLVFNKSNSNPLLKSNVSTIVHKVFKEST